jgi:hypothetical protein
MNASTRILAFDRTTLIFAESTPNTMVLARGERPLEALFADIAPAADKLGFFDLKNCRTRIADREEEFGVFV